MSESDESSSPTIRILSAPKNAPQSQQPASASGGDHTSPTQVLATEASSDEEPDQSGQSEQAPAARVPPAKRRSWWWSWLPVLAGIACGTLIYGSVKWWQHGSHDEAATEQVRATDDDTATTNVVQESARPTVATADPTAEATSEPTSAASAAADPTKCVFQNGNRPKVGDKYVLTCNEGSFLATGEYKPGGIYIFSAFEPHTP